MQACEGRLQSLGVKHLTTRSTFAEANARRSYKVFEDIYLGLYSRYKSIFPDSRFCGDSRNIVIVDSTSITLFKEILQGTSVRDINGKRKGAIKVHMAVKAHEDVPFFVDLTKGTQADVSFLKQLDVPVNSVVLMDRGYNNYKKFAEWGSKQIDWVTRRRKDSHISIVSDNPVSNDEKEAGVISDQIILMGAKNSSIQQVPCRLITYFDAEHNPILEFITNNLEWKATKVAGLYKRRWQIELLFKRLKQNMPLHYFLGDNENAIKIQIYCALIADLLLKISLYGVKRKWAFSNISCLVRLHLMHYTDLKKFLENPERARVTNPIPQMNSPQLPLYTNTGAC
jgi:transposase